MTLFVLLLVLVLSTFALVPLKLPFKCGKVVPINQDGFGCACGNSACGSSHSDNPGSLCFVFVPFFSNQKSKQNKKTKTKRCNRFWRTIEYADSGGSRWNCFKGCAANETGRSMLQRKLVVLQLKLQQLRQIESWRRHQHTLSTYQRSKSQTSNCLIFLKQNKKILK